MKSKKISAEIIVVLELNEKEASWLKSVIQNPIMVSKSEQEIEMERKIEHPENRAMRETFWEALTLQGVK